MEESDEPGFEEKAGFLSRLFVGWFMNILKIGAKQNLELKHLGRVHPRDDAKRHKQKFKACWSAEVAKQGMKDARVFVTLLRFAGFGKIASILLMTYVAAFSAVMLPQLKKRVLEWVEGRVEMSDATLWIYVVLIGLMPILDAYCDVLMTKACGLLAQHCYAGIVPLMFEKTLRLSPTARAATSSGKIVNLVSNDAKAASSTVTELVGLFTLPPQLFFTIFLVYQEVGWTMVGAFIPIVAALPLQAYVIKKSTTYQAVKKTHSDSRLKYLTDVVNGIRVIKAYVWEKIFWRRINEARKLELSALHGFHKYGEVMLTLMLQIPEFIPLSVFGMFLSQNGDVNPASLFTVIQYFNSLSQLIGSIPGLAGSLVMMKITFERLGAFLRMDELQESGNSVPKKSNTAISISADAIFQWEDPKVPSWKIGLPPTQEELEAQKTLGKHGLSTADEKTVGFKLQNLGVTVLKGWLVAIVGPIGCGKSSFLNAVLGEMIQMSGEMAVCGSKTYSMQQPWIQGATLRENILFGSAYIESWYKTVIHACALEIDIKMMDDGDCTEIGDRGFNLSGGQKARVSVARCLYSKADIVVLDDPLAAVDMHVGDSIFNRAICQVLREKTVLLVTNQLHRLKDANLILVLEAGSIKESGTMSELFHAQGGFAGQLNAVGISTDSQEEGEEEEEEDLMVEEVSMGKGSVKTDSKDPLSKPKDSTPKRLTKDEQSEEGFVDFRVYLWYLKQCRFSLVIGVVITTALFNSVMSGRQLFYGLWANELAEAWVKNPDADTVFISFKWLSVLAGIQCVSVFISATAGTFFSYGAVSGARNIQEQLWEALLHAPTGFFDVTPVGQILTLVTLDTMMIDQVVGSIMRTSFFSIVMLVTTLGGILMSTFGILLPFALVALYLFYRLLSVVRKTAVQLDRLSKMAAAPATTNFAQMLAGIEVVRAQGHQERFAVVNIESVNKGIIANVMSEIYLNPFVNLRLSCLGGVVNASTVIYAVVGKKQGNLASVGMAGVGLTLAGQLSMVMTMVIGLAISLESMMTSVERCKKFVEKTPCEKASRVDGVLPQSRAWPDQGKISFKNYVTGYRDGPDILKNITAEISPMQKIGVVGRSGSGKSTIVQSLFRLIEPRNGTIYIDGIDITKIGLAQLRVNLGIVPQDPIMFIGTVKYNIDPISQVEEGRLWQILEKVNMAKAIRGLPDKLEHQVAEGGQNFSVGQRQLICICRALFSNTKIMCLDEATASVDNEADALIQEIVRNLFKMQTVITIAHRLDTIMDSDRIMVLDKGNLVEFGAALELLDLPEGTFKALVEAGNADNLRKIAKHGYLAKVMCV